jgi:hypothetical protein
MNFILHSKIIKYFIHTVVIVFLTLFIFPNLLTHRDIPRWPILANRTVEGVDRNENNLRDDVEIRLHRKIDNDEDYLKIIAFAASVERRIHYKANTRSEGLEFFRNESCNNPHGEVFNKYNMTDGEVIGMVINTQARLDRSRDNVMLITGSGLLSEYLCGSTHDLSEAFEKHSLRPKKK